MVTGIQILGSAFSKKADKNRELREKRAKFFTKRMKLDDLDINELLKVLQDASADPKLKIDNNFRQKVDNIHSNLLKKLGSGLSKSTGTASVVDTTSTLDHNMDVMNTRLDMLDMLFDPLTECAAKHSVALGDSMKGCFDIVRRWFQYYEDYMNVSSEPVKFAMGSDKFS